MSHADKKSPPDKQPTGLSLTDKLSRWQHPFHTIVFLATAVIFAILTYQLIFGISAIFAFSTASTYIIWILLSLILGVCCRYLDTIIQHWIDKISNLLRRIKRK